MQLALLVLTVGVLHKLLCVYKCFKCLAAGFYVVPFCFAVWGPLHYKLAARYLLNAPAV